MIYVFGALAAALVVIYMARPNFRRAILSAARRMGERPLPTLAVKFGRLGFLPEVESRQLESALDAVWHMRY
mgnify:CR=1 FL=1